MSNEVKEINSKNSKLLELMREQIIEWYQLIENNALNNTEESKQDREPSDISLISKQQTWEDELDRVSDQFNGMIRLTLPSKKKPVKYQIFKIIKSFIGKDLTKSSLPVFLNEPLSLLQRMSEMGKFIHILHKAAKMKNSLHRLVYVAIWAATNFAGTRQRLHKPFNPLLGETFEIQGENLKIHGEQLSHHPPIGVVFIETDKFTVSYLN